MKAMSMEGKVEGMEILSFTHSEEEVAGRKGKKGRAKHDVQQMYIPPLVFAPLSRVSHMDMVSFVPGRHFSEIFFFPE